jgi:D-methionine transport system permease protein
MISLKILSLIPFALFQTLVMIFLTLIFAAPLGYLIGVYLYFCEKNVLKKGFCYNIASFLCDSIRSFPFAIFIIALLPLSKALLGSSFGLKGAILPMIIASLAYFARLCHQSFLQLPKDLISVAGLLGCDKKQLTYLILFKETLPHLILNLSLLCNAILGLSTIAGLIGAGGVGKLALDYGYYRFNLPILLINILIILLLGKAFQTLGEIGFKKLMIKRGLYVEN